MTCVNLVLGFPGVGKTTVFNRYKDSEDYLVLDSDSSQFPKDAFPTNYVDHLQEKLNEARTSNYKAVLILCSTHEAVRAELDRREIKYSIVYPERTCKGEYLKRYKDRGSPQAFIDLLDRMWDEWMTQLENQSAFRKFRLLTRQNLSDLIGFMGIH